MVTLQELRDTNFRPLAAAGEAWEALGRDLRGATRQAVDTVVGPTQRANWGGEAADRARALINEVDDEIELCQIQAGQIGAAVAGAYRRFNDLQQQLRERISSAQQQGMTVRDDGWVAPEPVTDSVAAGLDDVELQQRLLRNNQRARAVQVELAELVRQADDLDNQFAEVCRRYEPCRRGQTTSGEWADNTRDARAVAELLNLDPSTIPWGTAAPGKVKAWWDGLTPQEQELYLTAYPGRLGGLDGIPAVARDRANELNLRNDIATMESGRWTGTTTDGADPLKRAQNLLDRLETSETGPEHKRLYLLGIDNSGDGRVIVSMGNPDIARHVGVLVPGVGTDLGSTSGYVNRMDLLQESALRALPGGNPTDVAMTFWLGYDTPQDVWDARDSDEAEAGATALRDFMQGARTTNTECAHVTLVGHSYGSTTVGNALSAGPMAVDDVVVLGSPGMDVWRTSELNIEPEHFYAGTAADDPITAAGVVPVHKHDPAFELENNILKIDTSNHSGYWQPGSQSLENQGAIIAGRPENAEYVRRWK